MAAGEPRGRKSEAIAKIENAVLETRSSYVAQSAGGRSERRGRDDELASVQPRRQGGFPGGAL